MNKLRWAKLVWSDWSDDPALALCSLAAQGLWMRLMCIAAQGEPYGHVTINGKPPSMRDLARLIRPEPKMARLEHLIDELVRHGVCQTDAKRSLFSRRMESDWTLFGIRSEAANARWKKKTESGLHMQNPEFAFLESRIKNQNQNPPVAPLERGARGARANGSNPRSQRQSTTSIVRDMIRQEREEARHAETCACEARARMAAVARDPDHGDDGT